jgi:hypothetical protein
MKIEIKENIFEDILAVALGLDRYQEILLHPEYFSISFRRKFNSFFRVRRDLLWQEAYYGVFQSSIESTKISFGFILQRIFDLTGKVEPSFSSKMLHIINQDMPIWDQHVLKALKLDKSLKGSSSFKIDQAIKIYDQIVEFYESYLSSEIGKKFINDFDFRIPRYKNLSNVKKVDSVIWKYRFNE